AARRSASMPPMSKSIWAIWRVPQTCRVTSCSATGSRRSRSRSGSLCRKLWQVMLAPAPSGGQVSGAKEEIVWNMRRPALSAVLALLLTAPAALAEMPEGISHFTLPNGLETVVIEDHRAPVVVQMLWYKIGAADEPPGKSGIAHYLEHLMFKGTDKLEPGELSKTVTRNGGMDNAFTSYDYTTYFQRIASDRLPLIMEMEADRMANLKIGEDDWQAERQVVLEE